MAKQTGIIKLKGTVGGISFYKTADGHLAREKGGVDKNRMQNDPAFQRTRENGAEFGRAGKGGKVLRSAIRGLLQNAKDNRVVSRLTKVLVAIAKTDTTNERGLRTLENGNLNLLEGFEFNLRGKLGATLFAGFTKTFDRVTGIVTLKINAFTPTDSIAAPSGTTHFKVLMGAAALDFPKETSTFATEATATLPYDTSATAPITLSVSLTENSTLPVLQVLGIEFYQQVNGKLYALKDGAYNALSVVTVAKP